MAEPTAPLETMSPLEIKIELLRDGVTQADLARTMSVSKPMVNRVTMGKSVSHRVRREIADAIGKDTGRIWPMTYVHNGGPGKPGRPASNIIKAS